MPEPRVVIIVQARMGSTRLPGKSMTRILGKPMIGYLVERLKGCREADALVVATTENPLDDPLAAYCEGEGVAVFRGSEEDLVARYSKAAREFRADIIVRVSGDCPLLDPHVADKVIQTIKARYPSIDYAANTLTRTYPRGMDVEAFTMASFQKVAAEAKAPEEREHATPYYYRHPELFKLENVAHTFDLSAYRWTVDTAEDLKLITLLLQELYPKNPHFTLEDIVGAMKKHPDWSQINAYVTQKRLGE